MESVCVCVWLLVGQKVIIGLHVTPHCEHNDSPDSLSFSPNIATQMRRCCSTHTFRYCACVHELKCTSDRQRVQILRKHRILWTKKMLNILPSWFFFCRASKHGKSTFLKSVCFIVEISRINGKVGLQLRLAACRTDCRIIMQPPTTFTRSSLSSVTFTPTPRSP